METLLKNDCCQIVIREGYLHIKMIRRRFMSNNNEAQVFNPFLPIDEYIPDGEPHVFGDRVYLYGSHDKEGGETFCIGKSGGYYVFALPVDKELDLKKAAKAASEKNVELLPVKDINKVTGYIRGGCTPIGMKKQYPVIIHESALVFDEIIISGGRIGEQIFISPKDLLSVTNGKTADVIKE